MKKFLILIVVLCISKLYSAQFFDYADEDENCKECSKYFDKAADSLKQKITELLPFKVKGIGHCSPCYFTGVENFFRIPDKPACVKETPDGDTIRHMFVEFPNVTGQCHCQFSEDPVDTARKVLETIADPIILTCTLPHMIKSMKNVQMFPDKIEPEDVESLQHCLPAIADVVRQIEPIPDFKLGVTIPNSRVSFDLVTSAGSKDVVIKNVKVLNEDASNWKHQCEGPESIVKACKCLYETRYLSYGSLQRLKIGVPCMVEKRGIIANLLHEMACPV